MSTDIATESRIVAVDLFCGGGSLSTALVEAIESVVIERAAGEHDFDPEDVDRDLIADHAELTAVNHDATAIETHE